jgi:hypothetical protein
MTPLEKRSCGACQACCVFLKIAAPELRKQAGTPCRHLTDKGCGIYRDRPPVCRDYYCGWRLFPELDDSWRPDRSGVMITTRAQAKLPPQWQSAPYGVQLLVIGGEAAVTRRGFATYVTRLLKRGTPVFLSANSPAILLNEHLDPGREGGLAAVSEKLKELYGLLHAARWERGFLSRIPPLYRLQLDRWRRRMMAVSGK